MKLHQRAQVQFEVYGKQAGRWLIHGVCPERDLALGLAQSLRRRADTSAVRVVRETYYPDRDEAFERVIFESSTPRASRRWLVPRAPGPAPARSAPPVAASRSLALGAEVPTWVLATCSGATLAAAMVGALLALS